MTPRATRLLLMIAAFAVGLASMLAVFVVLAGRGPSPLPATASAVGGAFTLTDHEGRTLTDADLKGKPFLVFFGFTHCPDICPTTLFEVSEIFRALGSDAEGARALFVTVDPERDTPEKLKDYLSSFDPRLIGLTGTPEAIERMLKTYRVYAKRVPTDDGYTMDHTALVYLMDKNGNFVAPFNMKRTPAEAAAGLRQYL